MDTNIEISVIVPCYNADRYVNICLDSLSAQKEPSLEMILIDDGSTDATGAMLDAFEKREPRARVVHTPNSGVSAARNRGIAMARGHYIAFMDADDVLELGGLSQLYAHAVKTGADITSANHTVFDSERKERIPVEMPPELQEPREIVREIIHMHRIFNNIWNKLYRRELFDGLALDEGVRIGEDALLNMQLYLRAKTVAHLSERTYVYRVHNLSVMANMGRYREAHQPMLWAMNNLLLANGLKEFYFRDFLQSCIWVDEKESGILACMKRFNTTTRPLPMEGIDPEKLDDRDKKLYRITKAGMFPAFYVFMRIREKLTKKRWGIRR